MHGQTSFPHGQIPRGFSSRHETNSRNSNGLEKSSRAIGPPTNGNVEDPWHPNGNSGGSGSRDSSSPSTGQQQPSMFHLFWYLEIQASLGWGMFTSQSNRTPQRREKILGGKPYKSENIFFIVAPRQKMWQKKMDHVILSIFYVIKITFQYQ